MKTNKRKLTLDKETLRQLSLGDLRQVGGGTASLLCSNICPTWNGCPWASGACPANPTDPRVYTGPNKA